MLYSDTQISPKGYSKFYNMNQVVFLNKIIYFSKYICAKNTDKTK